MMVVNKATFSNGNNDYVVNDCEWMSNCDELSILKQSQHIQYIVMIGRTIVSENE